MRSSLKLAAGYRCGGTMSACAPCLQKHILLMEAPKTNDNRAYTNAQMKQTCADDSIRHQSRRQARRPARLADDNVRLWQRLIERRIWSVPIRGDDQCMALRRKVFPQAETTRHVTQEIARHEVDRAG